MMEQNEQPIEVNEDELINFVQDKLIENGFAVDKEAIAMVMNFEMMYLVEIGVVVPIEE